MTGPLGAIEHSAGVRRSARWLPLEYLAWLLVATAFARTIARIAGSPGRTVIWVDVTRLVATLLCVSIARFALRRAGGAARTEAHRWPPAITEEHGWAPVIATAAIMIVALVAMGRRNAHGLDDAFPGTPLLPATVILLAYAEEVYFREALPARLVAAVGARAGGFALAALASQLLYAAAHLPVMLLDAVPASPIVVAVSVTEAAGFGLMLLMLDPGGCRRTERVIIHSAVNLSLIVAPAALQVPVWRGGLMCLLGGGAMRLARWRATPPPDYTPAWQLANAARHVRAPRRPVVTRRRSTIP
jgi:hypothetical protein